jgi:hypothetical protein
MFDLPKHTIILAVAGSRAYGIHTDTSDVDVKGVAIPPARYFHGFLDRFEQADAPSHIATFSHLLNEVEKEVVSRSKLEGVVYELRKFLELASQANPNILDVLFCRDQELRYCNALGEKLREHRNLVLSAKAKHTFSGYATSQLKRIETHRRWLLDPPTTNPTRGDFELPEQTVIPADQLMAAQAAIQKKIDGWEVDYGSLEEPAKIELQGRIVQVLADIQLHADEKWAAAGRSIGYTENFLLLLDRERRYKNARVNWEQYQNWKTNRNADRSSLEAKYGYDTKHGAHLYRLMKMCREILETGKVNVWRGDLDADELRAIRRGEWPYERLVEWAKAEDLALEELYRRKAYVVPHQADRPALEQLCMELVETSLRNA